MMTTPSEDPLYPIFEEHLHSGLYDSQPLDIFIRDVVDAYWKKLAGLGHVPQRLVETLRQDLSQDVAEMLRLKIYGHFNMAEYNRARRKKSS